MIRIFQQNSGPITTESIQDGVQRIIELDKQRVEAMGHNYDTCQEFNISIVKAQCDFCKDHTGEQCKAQNPSWYTKKGIIRSGAGQRINTYVIAHTKLKSCIQFPIKNWESDEYDTSSTTEYLNICGEHLGELRNLL